MPNLFRLLSLKGINVERVIESAALGSMLFVPLLALWAVACLYMGRTGCRCAISQIIYFVALLAVAGLTVRTMLANDGCWLIHTSSLGVLIVSGVMRRPVESEAWVPNSAL